MVPSVPTLVRSLFAEEVALGVAIAILVSGVFLAYLVWQWSHRILDVTGIADAAEGTPLDRMLQRLGTSTVAIIAHVTALFVYIGAVLLALQTARLLDFELFVSRLTGILPRLFVAILALLIGIILGHRIDVVIRERLRDIKLPEATLIPELAKYSMFYIAVLIALGQVGVETAALLVLLGAYVFGLVFLGGLACKDLLRAGAAGIYLILTQPYTVGDEIRMGEKRGIVQEVRMFVTHVEADGEEYVIPNQEVFRSGVVRIRN